MPTFDCVVYDDGRPIGRIYEDRHALPELRWYWSLTVLGAWESGLTSGRVPTLEQAKAELQVNFKKWLVWSKLEEAQVMSGRTRPAAGAGALIFVGWT